MTKTRTVIGSVVLAALVTLTGCGSEDSEGDTDPVSETTSVPTGRPGGFDTAQLEEIQACLEAAGLEATLPTGQPSDLPSDFPTDLPSDFPTDLPSDLPTGAPGGGLGALQDPEVQAALEACGIDLPQAPGQD